MRIVPAIFACLLTMACTNSGHAASQPTRADLGITAPLVAARAAAERGNVDAVLFSLKNAMQDDVFPNLSADRQYEVVSLYGEAAYERNMWPEARLAAVRAAANPLATEDDWERLLDIAVYIGDAANTDLAFKRLTELQVEALSPIAGRQIYRIDALLREAPGGREARLRLGREMERENWTPVYIFDDPSLVWLHYAEALLEAGEVDKARAVVKRVKDPVAVMAMHADRRFDAIAPTDAPSEAASMAAKNYLLWAKSYVRDNPRMLSGRIAVIRALAIMNRPQEALAVTDEVMLALAHASRDQAAFDDMDDLDAFEGWKDRILASVGRRDEAIGGLGAAASCHCSGQNVLQLGRMLLEARRPLDAQRWLDDMSVDRLGPEDRMTLAQSRACLAVQRGDAAGVAKGLAFLAEHETWKPVARIEAMVCANQMDAAATALVAQLVDPRMRLAALSALQTYAPEVGGSAYTATLRSRWAALAAAPEVQAQVAKVGRINRYDLTWRDFIA